MMTGPDKALLLFSMLGDRSKLILPHLSPETTAWISSMSDYIPIKTAESLQALVSELNQHARPPVPRSDPFSNPLPHSISTLTPTPSPSPIDGVNSLFGETEVSKPTPKPGDLRTPDQIAKILSTQRPQLIAFVLSKIEESLRDQILLHFSPSLNSEVAKISVEHTSISDTIFDSIYNSVFIYSESDDLDNSSTSSTHSEKTANQEENLNLFSLSDALSSEEGFGGFSTPLWDEKESPPLLSS